MSKRTTGGTDLAEATAPAEHAPAAAPRKRSVSVSKPAGQALAQAEAKLIMARIQIDALALNPHELKHLQSHLLSNPLHALNEQCYHEVTTFRQLSIRFFQLRANSKAFLTIRADQKAIWSEGGADSRMVGLCMSSSAPAMYLSSLLINAREIILETYQDCDEVSIELYVQTTQPQLQGRVDLPPGASVCLQSRGDRSTVIGLSSFAIDLA